MTFLPQVNRIRAWLLFTALWIFGSTAWYKSEVEYSFIEAIEAKRKVDSRERDQQFQSCLMKNGLNWPALESTYKSECFAEAQAQCQGTWWCDVEGWGNFCIRAKATQCQDIGTLVEGDGSPQLYPSLSYSTNQRIKKATFYWNSGFSVPLKNALLLLLIPPVLLLVWPSVFRRVWVWLTSKK
jgi:hypothetical protein